LGFSRLTGGLERREGKGGEGGERREGGKEGRDIRV